MLETAIALLAAHVVADFVIQFSWIIRNKTDLRVFALHVGLVAVTAILALGAFSFDTAAPWMAIAIIVISHGVLDGVKTFAFKDEWLAIRPRWRFAVFSLDQLGHVIFIALAAWMASSAFADGHWAWSLPDRGTGLLEVMTITAGFLIATRAGGFAIGIFMERFKLLGLETKSVQEREDRGLREAGSWIGLLERALGFVLILTGEFQALGFLIAAKSILRFQYARDRSHSEYVIIGTLASFSWAIAAALLTESVLARLASA